MNSSPSNEAEQSLVRVPAQGVTLEGDLEIPENATGIVVFAHGSGSSRFSPRNRLVARKLRDTGLATLLIDLLTAAEEAEDLRTRAIRFDVGLLASRVIACTDWLQQTPATRQLPVGYFGASTGAAAALLAAAERPDAASAIVSRGGRPDLAGDALAQVKAPTLFIVGGRDEAVLALNRDALRRLEVEKQLSIVPGATHLFEEPGALERVADLAASWFRRYLHYLRAEKIA